MFVIQNDFYYTYFIYTHVHRKRLKRKCIKMLIDELKIYM